MVEVCEIVTATRREHKRSVGQRLPTERDAVDGVVVVSEGRDRDIVVGTLFLIVFRILIDHNLAVTKIFLLPSSGPARRAGTSDGSFGSSVCHLWSTKEDVYSNPMSLFYWFTSIRIAYRSNHIESL